MKRLLAASSIALVMTLAAPAKASADLTGFLGLSLTPKSRSLKGFAIGINVVLIGFEFEFANTVEDPLNAAPSLKTYSFNGTIMTPTRTQLYVTAGGGLYRERLGTGSTTSFDTNIGRERRRLRDQTKVPSETERNGAMRHARCGRVGLDLV